MWLFLLFLQSSIGLAFSNSHGVRIHQAHVAKLKCDSLPFRSMYDGSKCFFAVSTQVPFPSGSEVCHSVLSGAVMVTTTASRPVLSVLLVDHANYHSMLTHSQSKGVLCKYDTPDTCKDNEVKGIPGKCLRRLDTKLSFQEAKERCNSLENSKLITVNNDEENSAFASVIADYGGAWINQPSFDLKFESGQSEKIQYLRWFMGESSQRCAANTSINMVATKNGTCSMLGYWQPTPVASKAFAFCIRPSDGDFTPFKKKKPISTTTTTTKKPVDMARLTAACGHTQATHDELCANCVPATIENIGEGLRASCGSKKLLVFVPQNSIQPRFSSKFMECNLTSGGWMYNGQLAGQSIKMGCAPNEANGGRWCMKTSHGTWFQAYMAPFANDDEKDGGGISGASEKVVLRYASPPNQYLGARHADTVAYANNMTEAERWKPYRNGVRSWSFTSYHGRYCNAQGAGTIATQTWNMADEMFLIEPCTMDTVCGYTQATHEELCVNCAAVTIENIEDGRRASCGNGKLLVFVSQISAQPRFSSKFMECNLTSGGWIYNGQLAGQSIKMGCAWNEANGGRWRLKTFHGTWFQAYMAPFARDDEPNGGGVAGASEKVVLRYGSTPFQYLSARHADTVAWAATLGEAEKWKPVKNGPGSWSFYSYHGRYVNAQVGGTIATQTWNLGHEMYQCQPW